MRECPRCGSRTGLGNSARACQECGREYCAECAEWRASEEPVPGDVPLDRDHEHPLCSDECALKALTAFLDGIPSTEPVYLWNPSNVGLSVGEDVGEDEHGRSLDLVHEGLDLEEHEEDEVMTPQLGRLYGKVKLLLKETGHRYVEDFVPLDF
jgi:hypothetical protein